MPVGILIDQPSFSAKREGRLLTGFEQNFLYEKAARAGLRADELCVMSLSDYTRFRSFDLPVIVTLGEAALQAATGRKSLNKWHLSPLDAGPAFGLSARKILPTFDFTAIWRDWTLGLYFELTLKRARQNQTPGPWARKEERYVLGPDPEESIAYLEALLKGTHDWLSLDIETGRGQINTFGVATSDSDAIAVKVLPSGMPANLFKKLWETIARVCECDVPKVMQNGIYERTYLSRYGIAVRAFRHDTMCAQKFLWPELEKGLANVGRLYTMEPYWKDDGRASSEADAGKRKDWGDIRDWDRHFAYNCRDTTNTLTAMHAQRKDLEERGLLKTYEDYITRLFDPTEEMGVRGLPLNQTTQKRLISEYEGRSQALRKALSEEINPRSSKAKLQLLEAKGYEIPTKRSTGKKSTDELSLKRLRLKHPEDQDLRILLEIAGVEKALSSYLRVKTLPDGRVRFMLDPCSTETFRMSCSKDPWDGGMNIQTMNPDIKQMLEWADSSRVFVEIDLSQAESRFVALDAEETTLLGMLERKEDIHRYVAAEIFSKPMADITHAERQLGKKSGHGANYAMGVQTFQDSCLKELDLVLDRKFATRVLESYHRVFPGIHKWHARIRNTVYAERKLENPAGGVRYFYGRIDDVAYRQAYAWRPQSTIPWIANRLMLALCGERDAGRLSFWLHAHVHDSVLLSADASEVPRIAAFAAQTERWHPEVLLPGGRLIIPTELKYGRSLGAMGKFKTA